MEDTSQPMQEVVWGDDGIVRLEPYQYEPGRVPTFLLTQRSKVAATHHRSTIAVALARGGGLYACCSCGWTGARNFDAVLARAEWDQHHASTAGIEASEEATP
jgi:hypothetical protein